MHAHGHDPDNQSCEVKPWPCTAVPAAAPASPCVHLGHTPSPLPRPVCSHLACMQRLCVPSDQQGVWPRPCSRAAGRILLARWSALGDQDGDGTGVTGRTLLALSSMRTRIAAAAGGPRPIHTCSSGMQLRTEGLGWGVWYAHAHQSRA